MNLMRTTFAALAAVAMLTGTLVAPASAQQGGGNQGGGNNQGCTQTTGGNNTGGGNNNRQGGRPAGDQLVVGVIAAAIQNVTADVNALNGNILNNPNIDVVCLNNVLNNNQIQLLSNLLNNSPILSQNSNNLNNLLQGSNIALLNNVQVVSVNLASGPTLFLLRQ